MRERLRDPQVVLLKKYYVIPDWCQSKTEFLGGTWRKLDWWIEVLFKTPNTEAWKTSWQAPNFGITLVIFMRFLTRISLVSIAWPVRFLSLTATLQEYVVIFVCSMQKLRFKAYIWTPELRFHRGWTPKPAVPIVSRVSAPVSFSSFLCLPSFYKSLLNIHRQDHFFFRDLISTYRDRCSLRCYQALCFYNLLKRQPHTNRHSAN